MKNIKYLYFDLDGTLLDENKQLSSDCVSYLKKLIFLKKIKVGIATGRHPIMCEYIIEKIMPNLPIVYLNGGMILDNAKNAISLDYISLKDVIEITDFLIKEKNDFFVYNESKIFTNNLNNWRVLELTKALNEKEPNQKMWSYFPLNFKEMQKDKTKKIIALNTDTHNKLIKFINENYSHLQAIGSESKMLEIFPKTTSKYLAIQAICKNLNIDLNNELMFFGDNYNDLEAIEKIPYSVCVGEKYQDIMQAAKFVINTPSENSIYLFLKKHFPI